MTKNSLEDKTLDFTDVLDGIKQRASDTAEIAEEKIHNDIYPSPTREKRPATPTHTVRETEDSSYYDFDVDLNQDVGKFISGGSRMSKLATRVCLESSWNILASLWMFDGVFVNDRAVVLGSVRSRKSRPGKFS